MEYNNLTSFSPIPHLDRPIRGGQGVCPSCQELQTRLALVLPGRGGVEEARRDRGYIGARRKIPGLLDHGIAQISPKDTGVRVEIGLWHWWE